MCKAWTVATRSPALLRRLNLKCQKNHPRGKCEAGEAQHTARYTEPFARRVVECMRTPEVWSKVVQEINVVTREAEEEILEDPEETEAEREVSEEEKREIIKKVQHIHRTTGHGSMKNLVAAMKRRGVPPHVLKVAKEWTCPTCEERKRPDPRRFANLETIAKRWVGTWTHPGTRKRYHFVLFVDTGTRFMTGKIVSEHTKNNAGWVELKQALEELWFPIFGKPRSIRVDPAGPWLGNAVDEYMADRGISLDPIPGEAHWQIGLVENGIMSLKGVMEAVAKDFDEMEVREKMPVGMQQQGDL